MAKHDDQSPERILLGALLLITIASVILAVWAYSRHAGQAMKVDDLGAYIGGISSGLAFLWLIGMGLLQYRELRLQRMDLELQRNISQDQSEALQGSQRAASKQAATMDASLEASRGQLAELQKQAETNSRQLFLMASNSQQQARDRAVQQHVSIILNSILPALRSVDVFLKIFEEQLEPHGLAREAFTSGDYFNALLLLQGVIGHFPFRIDEKAQADIRGVPGARGHWMMYETSLLAIERAYGEDVASEVLAVRTLSHGLRATLVALSEGPDPLKDALPDSMKH